MELESLSVANFLPAILCYIKGTDSDIKKKMKFQNSFTVWKFKNAKLKHTKNTSMF